MKYSIASTIFQLSCNLLTLGNKRIIIGDIPKFPQPSIFISNHPTDLDICYFYDLLNNPTIMMNDELFSFPIIGKVLKDKKFIPVPLQSEKKKERSYVFREALLELLFNYSLFTCPEAKLTTSTSFSEAKTGVVRLAAQTNTPIVPISIKHKGRIYKKSFDYRNKNHPVTFMIGGTTYITFGNPYYLPKEIDAREKTKEMMDKISVLLNYDI